MTAAASVVLWCDRITAGMTEARPCRRLFDHRGTVDQARTAARAAGWTSTGIADFCPDHTTTAKDPRP